MSEDSKKIKVKILAHVGQYTPGQVIEVNEDLAKVLTEVKNRHDGHGVIHYQNAMLLEDYEKAQKAPVDKGGLTQGDLKDMGLKDANVVETPRDPAFEAHLKAVRERQRAKSVENEKKFEEAKKKVNKKNAALTQPAFEEKSEAEAAS